MAGRGRSLGPDSGLFGLYLFVGKHHTTPAFAKLGGSGLHQQRRGRYPFALLVQRQAYHFHARFEVLAAILDIPSADKMTGTGNPRSITGADVELSPDAVVIIHEQGDQDEQEQRSDI